MIAIKYAKLNYNIVFIDTMSSKIAKKIVLDLAKLANGEIRFYKLLDGSHKEIERIENYIFENFGNYEVLGE